jgi:ribbon-helix-helix protein, copG family
MKKNDRKQATIYLTTDELAKFDEIAESFGYSRASLIREVIKVFNENSTEFMKKIHKL